MRPSVDAVLEKLKRETFGSFQHEANPANDLVIDKTERGVPYGPDDGTLAPWAVVASLPFAPEIVLPSLDYAFSRPVDRIQFLRFQNVLQPIASRRPHDMSPVFQERAHPGRRPH